MPIHATNPAASSGPATAPRLSPARSRPKARPYACLGASEASMLSRAGERSPPRHPRQRSQQPGLADGGRQADRSGRDGGTEVAAAGEPAPKSRLVAQRTTDHRHQPGQRVADSLDQPEGTRGGVERGRRNDGSTAVVISCPESEKKLAAPTLETPRLSQDSGSPRSPSTAVGCSGSGAAGSWPLIGTAVPGGG